MKKRINNSILIALIFGIITGCSNERPLPILGPKSLDGKQSYTIPDFNFLNQDSVHVDNSTFENGIYIVDFFFTHCPSICPKVIQQMIRIQDEFKDEPLFKMASYTMDPKRDTPKRLTEYTKKLSIETEQWEFLTGNQDSLFILADAYWIAAFKDDQAPGGFDHSGKIILVDKNRNIRSFCDGTEPETVTRFINDIKNLLNETKSKAK